MIFWVTFKVESTAYSVETREIRDGNLDGQVFYPRIFLQVGILREQLFPASRLRTELVHPDEVLVDFDELAEAQEPAGEILEVTLAQVLGTLDADVDKELGEETDEGAGDAYEGAVAVGPDPGHGIVFVAEGRDRLDLDVVFA